MGSYREPAGSLEVEDMDWGMTSVDAAFNRLVAGVRPGRTSWGVTVRANQAVVVVNVNSSFIEQHIK